MNKAAVARQAKTASVLTHAQGILQRKCACGNQVFGSGECAECAKKKGMLQRKLSIGASNDPLEREADRVADQVMAAPANHFVSGAPPRIQRYTGQMTEGIDTAPASVDQALASPGRPLEPALRQDMEQRFGHDFSRVRVHTGVVAEQSARDVNANAYTVSHNIVFGEGLYAPGAHEGRRLIAHELTHVVQQEAVPAADALGPRISVSAEGVVQREVKPSHHLEEIARTAIDELDDDQRTKVLLATVLAAARRSELPVFVAILKAKPHETYGDYFIFLVSELESGLGSKNTVAILKLFADAGVNITKQLPTYSLEPLAAVAKFKSLVQQYRYLLNSGKVSEADKQRVGQLIAEAEMALRGIEGPPRKAGVQVKQMGGAAVAAGTLWKTAAILAADDVTVIGVANDVAIPFVVVAAAILSGIAIFTSRYKPEILDYRPAKEKVDAALALIILLLTNAAQRQTTKPKTTAEPIPTPTEPEERRKRRKCREKDDPCGTPLPIKWPKILPLPTERRTIIRTPSGDWNLEPDRRSQPQRDMQREILEARNKNVPPPRPCFRHDAEPNAPYDAHHMHPLFIGGAEDTKNLCALRTDYHQRGHSELYNQEDMLNDSVWIACRICEGNLRIHPGAQEYYISGRK